MGNVGLAVLGKGEHRLIGTDAELRARERKITLGIRRVETDGDGIEQPCKALCKDGAMFQLAQSVRIDARRHLRMIFLDMAQDTEHRVKAHQGLSEAAAYDFGDVFPRQAVKLFRDLSKCRIMVNPERGLLRHLLHAAQTENAVTVTGVRDIDIDGTLALRLLAQTLLHRQIAAARMGRVNNHNMLLMIHRNEKSCPYGSFLVAQPYSLVNSPINSSKGSP